MTVVKEILEEFVVSPERSAIVLKGKWGVGKTHLWDGVIRRKKEKLSTAYYSYVSLFGVGSLKELKQTIYENLLKKEHAAESGGVRSMEDRLEGTLSFMRRHANLISGVRGAAPLIESYQSSAISNVLICIDDFERKGKGLAGGEVLGLISMLVEKRKCKVVLILNEEGLATGECEFTDYREKVFSYEVEYQPTSMESASLVFDCEKPDDRPLVDNIVELGLTNVRLIRKIKHYHNYLINVVKTDNSLVWANIRSVIPLAVLARYGGSAAPVNLDDLEKFDGMVHTLLPDASSLEREKHEKKEQQAQNLRKYGHLYSTDLDRAIINLIKNGYIDPEVLKEVLEAAERQAETAEAEILYGKVWLDYHGNFASSSDEIIERLDAAVEACFNYLSVDRLGNVVKLYRELDFNQKADALIYRYFVRLGEARALTDRESLWGQPSDEKIILALDEYFSGFGNTMSLKDAIDFLLVKRSTIESVAVLFHSTLDDFFDYLTSPDTKDFKGAVKLLLSASHDSNIFDDAIVGAAKKIFVDSYGALRRVRDLSRLNEIRISPLMTLDATYDEFKSRI